VIRSFPGLTTTISASCDIFVQPLLVSRSTWYVAQNCTVERGSGSRAGGQEQTTTTTTTANDIPRQQRRIIIRFPPADASSLLDLPRPEGSRLLLLSSARLKLHFLPAFRHHEVLWVSYHGSFDSSGFVPRSCLGNKLLREEQVPTNIPFHLEFEGFRTENKRRFERDNGVAHHFVWAGWCRSIIW